MKEILIFGGIGAVVYLIVTRFPPVDPATQQKAVGSQPVRNAIAIGEPTPATAAKPVPVRGVAEMVDTQPQTYVQSMAETM